MSPKQFRWTPASAVDGCVHERVRGEILGVAHASPLWLHRALSLEYIQL